jgi:acetyltransferase-like isoleucine patch superfamily enzyme
VPWIAPLPKERWLEFLPEAPFDLSTVKRLTDAMIFDNDFHSPEGEFRWGDAAPDNPKPIKIGRGVFIGARALVLKGVTIGDRAVIGAGAVVTKDVPTQHIAVGNPARLLSAQNPA